MPQYLLNAGPDQLEKLPPQAAPSSEIQALKAKMARTLLEIRNKVSSSTVQDLKRLLFRCAATLISLPKVHNSSVLKPFYS
jgi:phosphatidylinositol 4-kinase